MNRPIDRAELLAALASGEAELTVPDVVLDDDGIPDRVAVYRCHRPVLGPGLRAELGIDSPPNDAA